VIDRPPDPQEKNMSVITADDALQARLASLKERTEIRDTEGKLIGVFVPAAEGQTVDYAKVRLLFDPEEIKRRKERWRDDPGRTLDQIMERLRSLERRE
jgi:hypothetical protein